MVDLYKIIRHKFGWGELIYNLHKDYIKCYYIQILYKIVFTSNNIRFVCAVAKFIYRVISILKNIYLYIKITTLNNFITIEFSCNFF